MDSDGSESKKTPLFDKHVALKAKMVDFAGFRMPVLYNSINAEHLLVREKVGIFDLSHMGEFFVSGKDAESFLQKVTVNDVSALLEWQIQYSCMCYPDGGIVDDLLVYRLPDRYMLVVNAACLDKDFAWLKQNLSGDVKLENDSDDYGLIAIQGRKAQKVLAKLTAFDLDSLPFYWAATADIGGHEMLFSRTGYTGEDGFELYVPADNCADVWAKVIDAGREFEMGPIGLGARDSLRLEMKYMLYGNDIDKTTDPISAGLGWIVKLDKGDFIGRDNIESVRTNKPESKLVAFEMLEKAIPRKDYVIIGEGSEIGTVTSGGFSPSIQKGIGLGYVTREFSKIGRGLAILIRGKEVPAIVVKPPFYKEGSHR
ncbi:MAG: glycine cleavage system aminomethyltransferase GcvT [candidate division Zixibacteria bacterium]|nr:glycine cleavage system aminomethyltransferase GcvT [candidate division Zixibacteria bacterium]MBU1470018.1 glycine cleavage system aminomethyltransferase GcvT [candidate division Zixibacteria bacterium]MBU2623946.1 glycine cleavage system aminomethyltransferase GcvT [candidate division Zixibacteria bacterium]